jgi:hypothetical protein
MKTKNPVLLTVMHVIFWIIFVGLCIKAGAILFSVIVSLAVNAEGARDLYQGLNLHELYTYSRMHYIQTVSFLLVLAGLKAYIAYLVVRIFLVFDLSRPFNPNLTDLFLKISYYSLAMGVLAIVAEGYGKWLLKKGPEVPIKWGSGEILFFAGVIYIIALVFQKGAEIQAENDLTV